MEIHVNHAQIGEKEAQNSAMKMQLAIHHRALHAGLGQDQFNHHLKSLRRYPLHQSPQEALPHVCPQRGYCPL